MRPALSGLYRAMTKKGVPAQAGSPTAPSVKQSNGGFGNGSSTRTTTLTNVVAGDLILVWAATYNGSYPPVAVTIQDSATGAFGDASNTYTPHQTTAADIGNGSSNYLSANAWSGVAQANATTLTIRCSGGTYQAIAAVNMGQVYDAAIHDDGGVRKYKREYYPTGGAPSTINETTYSHDFVIMGVAWDVSATNPVFDAAWPQILSVGDSNNNRLAVMGKAVTSAGTYTPTLTFSGSGVMYAAFSFVIKGKNV